MISRLQSHQRCASGLIRISSKTLSAFGKKQALGAAATTKMAENCPDIFSKTSGFVATNMAEKCPQVLLKAPSGLTLPNVEMGS